MPLTLGQSLGRYEIVGILGSGGMGQVYRGHDPRLNRDVAIKVLLPTVADDSDRLARLSREAQLLASLNHANIAAIYGIEDQDGIRALIMELVEGPTLATRIAQGPLPLSEVLLIARQIADALASAHDQGVIHRDLKPANIKVRADGTVKVLDFGLAKAVDDDSAVSPTVSTHLTRPGLIMGTAAYMSPEQAAGQAVDARTDIWTFGVVLFEMLTGRPAFTGETASHVMAAVLTSDPDWRVLPAHTPPALRRVLRRCLERERRRRLAHASDARLDIDEAMGPAASAEMLAPPAAERTTRSAVPWLVTLAAITALTIATLWMRPAATGASETPVWMDVRLGGDAPMAPTGFGPAATLSPDGRTLAFVAERAVNRRNLYVRRLDQLTAAPLSGTEGAEGPFFSPDGQWLGFFADGKLKKVATTGGAPVVLCDAPSGRGGDWLGATTIVFQPNSSGPLMQVAADGGTPTAFSTLADGEVTHRWPQVLPGNQDVIFTANSARVRWDDSVIVAQNVASGARTVVLRGGYFGRYASSGHLLYVQNTQLYAAAFDLASLTVSGTPVVALRQPLTITGSGAAQFAITPSGTALYEPRRPVAAVPMSWMTSDGTVTPLRDLALDWRSPQFSPDGRQIALDVNDGRQLDVVVGDWSRGSYSTITRDAADDFKPVWTPDGRHLVFSSNRSGVSNLYWHSLASTAEPTRLTESANLQVATSWHPNGRLLAFQENRPETGYDLMVLPFNGNGDSPQPETPRVLLATPATETEPMFSPDGQWIAYVSNDTGRDEIYVRPSSGPGGPWAVSTAGGGAPTWSRVRSEILYRTPGNQVMVATYRTAGGEFTVTGQTLWASTRIGPRRGQRSIDLHPDGNRLAIPPAGVERDHPLDHVTLVLHMFDELNRLLPRR